MKIQKTYFQLLHFNSVAKLYAVANPENKLTACINSFSRKQLRDHIDQYEDLLDEIQIKNCAVDEKTKVMLYTESTDNFGRKIRVKQFTIVGELAVKAAAKDLLKKSVECHARICDDADLIAALTDNQKEAFSGIVIPEQVFDQEETQ